MAELTREQIDAEAKEAVAGLLKLSEDPQLVAYGRMVKFILGALHGMDLPDAFKQDPDFRDGCKLAEARQAEMPKIEGLRARQERAERDEG